MSEAATALELAVRAVLSDRGCRPTKLTVLGAGLDHAAYVVDDHLVVRIGHTPAELVVREAELLRRVAAISPLPTPRPVWVEPAAGCLAYRMLPGQPLLHTRRTAARSSAVGTQLGRLLTVLHTRPADDWSDLIDVDDTALESWLAEATQNAAAARELLPRTCWPAVEAFLDAVPPPAAGQLAVCHNDLGSEHLLVDQDVVTGVLDWSDAARTDPARDLALIYRDLGPPALHAVLAAYRAGEDVPRLLDRVRFYARCGLLEDLVHGLRTGQHMYAAKSLAGLQWLFPPTRRSDGS